MKELKVTGKQKEILDSLYQVKKNIQSKLIEIDTQINLTSTLIFDMKNIEIPEKAIYKDGVIQYEENDIKVTIGGLDHVE